MSVKQVGRNFVCQFDIFSASTNVRKSGDDSVKSFSLGIVVILFGILFTYMSMKDTVDLLSYKDMEVQQGKSFIGNYQPNGTFIMLGLTLDFLTTKQFQSMFTFQMHIQEHNKGISVIQMKPCKPEQWNKLQQDSMGNFFQNDIRYLYCPDVNDTMQFNLRQTLRSQNASYVYITLKACDPLIQPFCQPSLISTYLSDISQNGGSAQVWVYVLDKVLNPYEKDPIKYFINTDAKVQVSNKFGGAAAVQFLTFEVQTDTSFFPVQSTQKITGSEIDQVRNYPFQYNDVLKDKLAVISFSMNVNLRTIKRKYGKLDQAISYAGGLFSMIAAVLAFYFSNFNKYRYEIQFFNQHNKNTKKKDQNQIEDMGFFLYVKYTIFDWVKVLFCRQLQWDDCKKIQEIKQKANKYMDINEIIFRIQNLENYQGKYMSQNYKSLLCFVLKNILMNRSEQFSTKELEAYLQQLNEKQGILTIQSIRSNQKQFDRIQQQNSQQPKEESKETIQQILSKYPNIQAEAISLSLSEISKKIQIAVCQYFLKDDSKNYLFEIMPIKMVYRVNNWIHNRENRQSQNRPSIQDAETRIQLGLINQSLSGVLK